MKAVDTSVLLALLEGDGALREFLKRQRGIEIATTEANLLELSYVAAHGEGRGRAARREALDRLRRKITVLPMDARAVEHAARRLGKEGPRLSPLVLAMLSTLEVGGCEELFTREVPAQLGKWKFKITRLGHSATK